MTITRKLDIDAGRFLVYIHDEKIAHAWLHDIVRVKISGIKKGKTEDGTFKYKFYHFYNKEGKQVFDLTVFLDKDGEN